ncbi:hypothetical protein F5148DRAFT_1283146 [Russula earlei]|uniref:Uncharacterized protein n=1 Tax=Russula earlei TaxID=71964 RepID=A0ACC0UCD0_9AGAM|nr:hypothetical protein F5148DRAFT_1283146 [Russula earlei]
MTETRHHLSSQPSSPPSLAGKSVLISYLRPYVQMADPENTYKFNVKMTCGGCSGAVSRALGKVSEGVSSYDVSLEKQEVLVKGTLPFDDVLAVIKKTGKQVLSGEVVSKQIVPEEAGPEVDVPKEAVPVEVVN